ncbi:hypothetical protein F4781DRAFT_436069 [Annulohypoxylon bovei var. microspora]|nr:hypothetical protein F4781DRAFT_436069 [Annulohypoxylon bovei var. microspora]
MKLGAIQAIVGGMGVGVSFLRHLRLLLQVKPKIKTKMSEHDWSLQELFDALSICLHQRTSASGLFVDGLDEIQSEERGKVIELVETLAKIPNMKVCVASRPENLFYQRLGLYPTLRVQDITHAAILNYARETLDKYKDSLRVSEKGYQHFFEKIVLRSEGVFLWAALVLKSLIEGIEKQGDSWEMLNRRIGEFSPGLNDLYRQMWNRQNADLPIYKRETAEVFWFMLHWVLTPRKLLPCLLNTHQDLRGELQRLISTTGSWTFEDEFQICNRFREWLSARSAGLIETDTTLNEYASFDAEIQFIHRSVREFLEGTEDGQEIVKHVDQSFESRAVSLAITAIDTVRVWAAEPTVESEIWPARTGGFAFSRII